MDGAALSQPGSVNKSQETNRIYARLPREKGYCRAVLRRFSA
jgi:hypothetical protein